MNKDLVIKMIEKKKSSYIRIARKLWEEPELSYQEKKSSALQKKYLRDAGFRVIELDHVQNYAFIAEYGSGRPVIGLLGEFDALPGLSQKVRPVQDPAVKDGPGHGCGHNLLGTACLAAAEGVKAAIDGGGLKGTVKYFGCPAEEQLGKPALAKAGVFSGLDAVLSWHPSDVNTVAAYGSNASVELIFKFHGAPAHAAQVPHLGRSALDALTLMSVGVEFLREHMPTKARIHYIVLAGGERPNIVPKFASGAYQVRSPRMKEAIGLVGRVLDVARGAALMTGTEVEWEMKFGCWDVLPNRTISDVLHGAMKSIPVPKWTTEELDFAKKLASYWTPEQKRNTLAGLGIDEASAARILKSPLHEEAGYWGIGWSMPASTDVGDVSHIAPTAQINTATWPVGVGAHSWQSTAASGSSIAEKGMIYAAKVLGAAVHDLMSAPETLKQAAAEFKASTKGESYSTAADLVGKLSGKGKRA